MNTDWRLRPGIQAFLVKDLKDLRDMGNTVIVVEHEEEIMRAADLIIDMGPERGRLGGEIVSRAVLTAVLKINRLLHHTLMADSKLLYLLSEENGIVL
jgi:excinuclease ABC subunit A